MGGPHLPRERMRVTADLVRGWKTENVELEAGATGLDLLQRLGLAPDAHLILRGDLPIPVDEPLVDGDVVRILAVVSGG